MRTAPQNAARLEGESPPKPIRTAPGQAAHVEQKLRHRMNWRGWHRGPQNRIELSQADDDHLGSQLGPLAAVSAVGVLLIAVADAGGRAGDSWAAALFWLGLLVILLPSTYRLIGSGADRSERLGLVFVLGVATYAVTVLHSPTGFALHDELAQYRSTYDILRTGRLLQPNPIVADYPYYPGILAVTAALSKLTGLGIFTSGLIVVAMARCLLIVSLFGLVERITKSHRIAGIAVVLYAANPNFVFFDAQFAYETLGLALAVLALWTTSRLTVGRTRSVTDIALVLIVVVATVLTHHLTSYFLCLMLVMWAVAHGFWQSEEPRVRRLWLALLAAAATAATAAWAVFAYGPTQKDIGASVVGSLRGLLDVITGSVATKVPFTAPPAYADTAIAEAIGLLSVGLLVATLPWVLWAAWREKRRHPLVLVFGLVALTYPVTLAVRLTQAGTEASNRSSEFVFFGLAIGIAIAAVRWLGPIIDRNGLRAMAVRLLSTAFVGIVFLGGVIIGWAPYARLPGKYLVESNPRAVNPLDVDAARWAGRWLPRGTPILTDIDNELLMAAYGNMDPEAGKVDGTPVSNVFSSPFFGAEARKILRFEKIRYLVVDSRLDTAPPAIGEFFRGTSLTNVPLPARSLAKFAAVPGLDRTFDSGPIKIYDTSPLLTRSPR